MTPEAADGCWPYDSRSEQVQMEQERDRLMMKQDLDDAWRVILDHLPKEWDRTLSEAVRFVEARAIGN